MHRGLPCSTQRVRIHGLHEVVPQAATMVSFSCGTPPVKTGLLAILFKLNDSIEDSIETVQFKSYYLSFILFLDRSQI
jgi:hypothetical protein